MLLLITYIFIFSPNIVLIKLFLLFFFHWWNFVLFFFRRVWCVCVCVCFQVPHWTFGFVSSQTAKLNCVYVISFLSNNKYFISMLWMVVWWKIVTYFAFLSPGFIFTLILFILYLTLVFFSEHFLQFWK